VDKLLFPNTARLANVANVRGEQGPANRVGKLRNDNLMKLGKRVSALVNRLTWTVSIVTRHRHAGRNRVF
jgi:hypothetical protein